MEKSQYKILAQIDTDSRFVTYHALQETGGAAVLLKIPKSLYPSVQVRQKLELEYAILRKSEHPNIIRILRIEPYENSIALILEHLEGQTLQASNRTGLKDLNDFFEPAIKITSALKQLHSKGIIHKNINPQNILIGPQRGQLTLTGFSLAEELSREAKQPNFRETVDTNLAYISPEQTGRMNRVIDQRSDLYSLGVVFYEMLTGSTPFTSNDPMELMHSHIARQPRALFELKPEIPDIISSIVLKLLSKTAEERYQSASGLLNDLIKCQDLFKRHFFIESFTPGEKDIHDQFRIPDKLYGRSLELNQLLSAYKSACLGSSEMLLISGYSGIGKSQLVNEVKKTITQGNGFFISGKFDQFKRDIPLSSLLAAFRELILQILAKNDDQIAEWKNNLMQVLGSNGKIITDVIPEVELLIGLQPPVPELPAVEANNRFNSVIYKFVNSFAKPEHPLCIFLDDLQWIDSSTRQWIETEIGGERPGYFMLIGAYRDNEITASHPLLLMLERLKESGIPIGEVNLQPLDKNTLNQMVAEVLFTTPGNCLDLSELIFQKTNGNPFFTRQCLLTLFEKKAIYFDAETNGWQYLLEIARNAEISTNVLELMSGQIQSFDAKMQKLLKTASCIGGQFRLELLNQVNGDDLETTSEQVAVAMQKGMILPVYSWSKNDGEEFMFLHDRVQQAAYNLLDDAEKKLIRLKTGRILLEQTTALESEEKIYEIADHLNYAQEHIVDSVEIASFVEVNLAASERAKAATAYEPALRYINQAMQRMPYSWEQHTILSRKLLLQKAECEHLNGNNEVAESFYDKAIVHAGELLEKAKVYQRKIHFYTNLRQFKEAYQTGREAVKPLGVTLPPVFVPPVLIKDLLIYRALLGRKKINDIIFIREMTDEKLQMAIQLMATFARAAYQIKPELCVSVCTKMVSICLKNGNTDGGFIGFLALGPIFLGSILNRKQTGYDFGQLILALVEKYNSQLYRAETNFVVGYFAIPWRRSALEMERHWLTAYEAGLEVGDFFHTSCACCATIQSHFMRGVAFDDILSLSDRYLEFLKRINNQEGINTIQSVRQSIYNLRGETNSVIAWDNASFNEEEYVKELAGFQSRHFAHYYFINKMQTLYLWGHYEEAYEISVISDKYLKDSPGMLHTAEHFFYKALIIAALLPKAVKTQRTKWLSYLQNARDRFQGYTIGCAHNFQHKFLILEAELSRAQGTMSTAQNYYYSAIDAATKYGYTNVHALANLLLAKFYSDSNRRRLAEIHLQDAVYGYRNLGATYFADKIAEQFPGLSVDEDVNYATQDSNKSKSLLHLKSKAGNLDLSTILKSSEAISREIRLKDLLSSLLKIILENAGAERMLLLLQLNDTLVVQAECLASQDVVTILPEIPIDKYKDVAKSVINYVSHAQKPVILDDAAVQGNYINDSYFIKNKTRSVLCAPLVQQGNLTAIIYLENNLTNAAFTKERIDLLILLSGQMAISINNALLYENLEQKVKDRTRQLNEEKDKSEALLLNILPAETAEELKRTGTTRAKDFAQVTVLFTDFKNFTLMSENLNAQELVSEINYCYSAFDNIITKYGIEKIKTIGDSYMCAGGVPVEKFSNPLDTIKAALEIRDFMLQEKRKRDLEGKPFFELRIGLHTGPVVAGIVGIKKFAYDIWGDTVNIASRMESSGSPGKINVSGSTYELIKDECNCLFRGKIEAKNKGMIEMYFVESLK
ncbi:MAG: adenylate/guanylate cyclase domain-containing protein [Bacteroidota bacterium]